MLNMRFVNIVFQSTLNSPHHCPGARLYHSTASVWLSVDPLSDKYPSVSPYVYCANNPVRLVDPDGRVIWEIDEYGKLLNTIPNDSKDMFRIITSEGDCIESPVFNQGTFGLWKEKSDLMFTVYESDEFEECDNFHNNDSKIAFDFLKENTRIEWECVYTTDGHFIGNSQQENHSGGTATMALGLSKNPILKLHDHSHPSGSMIKSVADHKLSERYPNTELIISPKGASDVYYNRCLPYRSPGKFELTIPTCY